MNKIKSIFLFSILILIGFFVNSCDPFDDIYLTLAMDTEFSTVGGGSTIDLDESLCLSDFEDYEDNKDKLESINYLSSAYITLSATSGLQSDSLVITLYQGNGTNKLFAFKIPNFRANDYVNNPLKITLTPQEINNINSYLVNPQQDKCFKAKLNAYNVQPVTGYQLNSKIEFLTELKIKP